MNQNFPGESGSSRRRRLLAGFSWLAVAAPFLLYLALVPHFGELQRNDYWRDFHGVLNPDKTLTHDPLRWLAARSNEHRIGALLPIWLLNARLTAGDNRGLAAFSFLILAATFALLYRRLPEPVKRSPLARLAVAAPLAALVVTPMAAHNWVMAFSGNQWFLSNLLAVGAFFAVTRARTTTLRDLALPIFLAVLASFVHSTYVGIVLGLAVAAFWQRTSRGARLGAVAFFVLGVASYLLFYQRPAHHAAPSFDPLRLASFICEYVGGALTTNPGQARILGVAALILLTLAIWGARRLVEESERRRVGFWLLVALYGLVAAGGTAVLRVNFPEDLAVKTSRYATLPNLVWIGAALAWTSLVVTLRARPRWKRALWGALGILALGLVLANYRIGLSRLDGQLSPVRWQAPAGLAMRWGIRDAKINHNLSPYIPWRDLDFFRALGHRPFDAAPEGRLGSRYVGAPVPAPEASTAAGSWTATTPTRNGFLRVSGTFTEAQPPGSLVRFLDADGVLRGAAVAIAPPASWRRQVLGLVGGSRSWIGYLDRRFAAARPFLEPPEGGPLRPLAVTWRSEATK